MSPSSHRPVILFRVHPYNKVSWGALLGACPADLLAEFRIVLWNSTDPPPAILHQERVLLCYSFMTPHVPKVREELALLRRDLLRQPFLLAGGAHAINDTDETMEMGFDAVVAGEAEEAFPRLLTAWLDGKPIARLTRIPPGSVDLNQYPGFHRLLDYLPPIEISRGCRYGCQFCAVPRMNRGHLQHRSVDRIVSIIEEYFRIKPLRKRIKFLASNSFGYGSEDGKTPNIPVLVSFLQKLKEIGVPEISFGSFPSEVRPDFVTREVLDAVDPYLSNRTIVMGIQSGDDAMLKRMNRGHTRQQAIDAVRLLSEYGFTAHVDFIIGFPGETFEDQDALLTFMEEMVHTYSIRIHMHTFMPLPNIGWGGQKPSVVGPDARKRLKALTAHGVLDGWWENQIGYYRRND